MHYILKQLTNIVQNELTDKVTLKMIFYDRFFLLDLLEGNGRGLWATLLAPILRILYCPR